MKVLILFCFTILSTSPAFAQTGGVKIEKDISYLPGDRKEKADLYLPAEDGKRHPAVLIVHGGGWSSGIKDAAREINIGTTLARHGYVCMSIDYLLGTPETTYPCWPQNLHDCKTAVRWLRANAERLHIDPENIGAIGGSAGGHLVSMVGVTQPKDGLDPAGPYGDQSCAIKCVVNLYGPANPGSWKDVPALRKTRQEAPELYKQFSVLSYLDSKDPSFLILHGTADKIVDSQQSVELAAALTKAGIPNQLELLDGAPHTFHLQSTATDLRPMVVGFFNKHLRGMP